MSMGARLGFRVFGEGFCGVFKVSVGLRYDGKSPSGILVKVNFVSAWRDGLTISWG